MNTTTLKSGWSYALSLFKWSELKPIILASLLATKRSFKHILSHSTLAAFLAILCLVPAVFFSPGIYVTKTSIGCSVPPSLKLFIIPFSLLFLMAIYAIPVLALRTSHERKDFSYFWSAKAVWLIAFSMILLLPAIFFGLIVRHAAQLFPFGYSLLVKPITSAFWITSTLFFLDALTGLTFWRSVKIGIINGLKMTAYFTPIFLFPWQFTISAPFLLLREKVKNIATALEGITVQQSPMLKMLSVPALILAAAVALAVLVTLMYSFYAILYIKIRHNHHGLFFEQINKPVQQGESN